MQINVTKAFLPPAEEYRKYLDGIWSRVWLTNHGPLVTELESRLCERLGLTSFAFVANGTIALQIAIKALGLKGEIVTTPFSYVATTSSIVWENCAPVMVDIDPATLTIDAAKIEAAITPRTSAILATHVYGNACDIHAIQTIADKHGLKVIYDAAHAFGSTFESKSLFAYGDISTASFHATKLFHTVEGGGLHAPDPAVQEQIGLMRNFGHISPTTFGEVGINGKNSEFHAAMGLCNLRYIDAILQRRAELSRYYTQKLAGLPVSFPGITKGCGYNYAYYPVILESEAILLRTVEKLNFHNIFPRRYFYPSLASLPYVGAQGATPVCDDIAPRILCLPLFHDLTVEEIDMIVLYLKAALKK